MSTVRELPELPEEREAFEAWVTNATTVNWTPDHMHRSIVNGQYSWDYLNRAWEVWQARAAYGRECARLAAGEWMDIASAPKDKPILLGYASAEDDEDSYVGEGRWWEGYDDAPDEMGHDAGFMDAHFAFFQWPRSFGAEKYRTKGRQPTHWQHLPKAPPPPASIAKEET